MKFVKMLLNAGARIFFSKDVECIEKICKFAVCDKKIIKLLRKNGLKNNIDMSLYAEYKLLKKEILSIIILLRNCQVPFELVLDLIDSQYKNNTIWEDLLNDLDLIKKMKLI